jgi:hypothetical protein
MFWLLSRNTTELAPDEDVTPDTVPSADTLPLASRLTERPDGYVRKTLTVPEKVTALPELLEA